MAAAASQLLEMAGNSRQKLVHNKVALRLLIQLTVLLQRDLVTAS